MKVGIGLLLASLAAGVVVGMAPVREAPPRGAGVARVLMARLRATGRAEVSVRLARRDPLSGRTRVARGRLALELPRLASLTLENGERLTLREDGGDWLQPSLRQLVRAGPRSAEGALVWWGALLDPAGSGVREERVGPREYRLVPTRADGAPAQVVELGPDGLPRRLRVEVSPGERVEYRLSGWRFGRPRGQAAFRLEAPAGFDVVDMP
jgi:hypothetical protein